MLATVWSLKTAMYPEEDAIARARDLVQGQSETL